MTILLLFALSLDSLIASVALGALRIEHKSQIRFSVAFGICDAVASFARCEIAPASGSAAWVASPAFRAAMVSYLIAVLVVCFFAAASSLRLPLLWSLPIALSLDNLAGPCLAPFSIASAALVALATASMSIAGFRLGTLLAGMAHNISPQQPSTRRRAQ
jgi:putative Mn2+ efflux pump MntP